MLKDRIPLPPCGMVSGSVRIPQGTRVTSLILEGWHIIGNLTVAGCYIENLALRGACILGMVNYTRAWIRVLDVRGASVGCLVGPFASVEQLLRDGMRYGLGSGIAVDQFPLVVPIQHPA